MTWVYDEIYLRQDDPNITVITASINDNPHINPAEIDLIAEGLTEEERKIRLNGEFVSLHGLVYKEFADRPPYVIEPFDLPDDWTIYMGMDPHLRTETGVLFCAVNREGDLFVVDELFTDGLISDISQKILHKLDGRTPFLSLIDPSSKQPNPVSGVSIRDEFARHGIMTREARKDVGAGIYRVREYLKLDSVYKKPRLFIFNSCRRLRYEFMHYVWDDDYRRINDTQKQSPRKKDDHLLDCLRYVIMEDPVYIPPAKKSYLRKYPNRCGY
jgi:hypothetical protein